MSKTRDTGFLGNVVKVDASGNVSFVSGSTTLATINTSGQLSGSSPVLSASYASNAELLDGLDSTVFTLTSSFNAQTASFTAFTSSINSFSASILSYTASQNITNGTFTTTASFNAQTASFTAFTASINAFSASILTFTGSASTRLGTLESYTASINDKTSSFATTGSNAFIGTQTITGSVLQSGSFTSTGTLTAQTLVVQTITSSVVYSSGSNIFGNAIANTQTFTGSVLVTGSLTIAGTACFASTICAPSIGLATGGTINNLANIQYGGYTWAAYNTSNGTITISNTSGCGINFATGEACFAGAINSPGGTISQDLRIYRSAGTTTGYINFGSTGTNYFGFDGTKYVANGSISATSFIGGTMSGTTIYGSTAVCSPVGKFTSCIDAGSGTFTGGVSIGTTNTTGKVSIQQTINDSGLYFFNCAATSRFMFNHYFGSGINSIVIQEFTTGNTLCRNIMSIDAGGNVGINTVNNIYKLTVQNGDVAIGNGNQTSGDFSQAQAIHFLNETTIPLATIKAVRTNWAQGQTDLTFSTYNSGMGEKMRITSDGRVGINVSPAASTIFHVQDNTARSAVYRLEPYTNAYESKLVISSRSSGDGGIRYGVGGGNDMNIFSYGTMRFNVGSGNISGNVTCERLNINTDGIATFSCNVCAPKTVTTGTILFRSNVTTQGDFFSYQQNISGYGLSALAGGDYVHIKTNITKDDRMVGFNVRGYMYAPDPIDTDIAFYTYSPIDYVYSVSIYEKSYTGWNYCLYYSSDNKVVLVVQGSGTYGGFILTGINTARYNQFGEMCILGVAAATCWCKQF